MIRFFRSCGMGWGWAGRGVVGEFASASKSCPNLGRIADDDAAEEFARTLWEKVSFSLSYPLGGMETISNSVVFLLGFLLGLVSYLHSWLHGWMQGWLKPRCSFFLLAAMRLLFVGCRGRLLRGHAR